MAEKGQVTQVKPDNKVVVKMIRTEACGKCRACMVFSSKEMIMEAMNECNAKAEDWVELELQKDSFYSAVLIMYGFPSLGLMLGIVLGYFGLYQLMPGFNREILGLICGLIGIYICHLVIKKNNYRWENNKKYIPVAARLADPPTPGELEYQLLFDENRK
ncbi:hypothetical protein SDC9_136288 [bioreactor metagenome]|uniref:Protein RseC n=1 Tax=bioreactor metagenome TaxID=1076179 RepID=A0A645DI72_9ZZZZ|nr:SoxR reducing system RseC family protein [Candidatus Metalachnospira sp.]